MEGDIEVEDPFNKRHMYPHTLFVRVGNHYTEISTKLAYCFATLRKKLAWTWQVTKEGPEIDPNWSEGIESRPLDITDVGVSLSDFKIITMLIDDDHH